jgi:NADPH:quinone reductase-like Zn-dependent oxidoreductase
MKVVIQALLVTCGLGVLTSAGATEATGLPATTRKIVLEKIEKGYRWKQIEAPVPTPGDHQVLVRVRAVGLNRGDWEILELTEGRDLSGLVAASDAAGDVVAVGSQVKSVRKGDRVTSMYFKNWPDGPPTDEITAAALGADVDGVLADYILLEEGGAVPIAGKLSYEEAATLPTAGVTAWMATAGRNEIGRGTVVLVQGTGGVSVFALQFAAALGARVIATSSSDDKLRRAKELGAWEGINYRTTPAWSDRVRELTGGHGADLVVDVGGKDSLEQSVKSLAHQGTLSVVGGLTGYGGSIPAIGLLMKSANAKGVFVGSRADAVRMGQFIARYELHPVIDRVFPFEEYEAALKHLASGNPIGRVVLKLE